MGLIAQGNQEVIEDKVTRVGTNGMVIFDKVGPQSNVHNTASNYQVTLIQIRNNRPLQAMFDHLSDVVQADLIAPPTDEDGIRSALGGLSDDTFTAEAVGEPIMTDQPKRKRRPKSDRVWPEPIPDTFENVIDVLANSSVRKDDEWKFLNEYQEPESGTRQRD